MKAPGDECCGTQEPSLSPGVESSG